MRILRRTPRSVLWLLDGVPDYRENLTKAAEQHGVSGERLIFAKPVPADRHLARLKLGDLFLDGLPYNAHTTASDALWAGLPLLTRRGTTFPGRVAASLLKAAGLPELITETPEEFERMALELASDTAMLAAIKEKLARNRLTCPLFDTGQFCRHMEAAFAKMREIAQRGDKPHGFSVA
jgi:protein O-GlcNAc transferase